MASCIAKIMDLQFCKANALLELELQQGKVSINMKTKPHPL